MHPRYCVTPIHQGAKWEDREGLCPSGVEACLQTKEDSEKRTNAGEEQDPRAETDRSVYEIPCKECPEVYTGETKRTLKVRLSEHRQTVKRGDPKNGIAVHVQRPTIASTGKAPQFEEELKSSGWGELWKPSRSEKLPRTWTWTAASSYPWSGTLSSPTSHHPPHHLAPFCLVNACSFLPLLPLILCLFGKHCMPLYFTVYLVNIACLYTLL